MLVRNLNPVYTVTGIKTSTGRSNTRKYKAKTPEEARAMAEQDDIVPDAITRDPDREPTEPQIDYAKSLGVNIPPDVTFDEISDLIDNGIHKRKPADSRTHRFADRYGVEYTQYTSKQRIFTDIHGNLRAPGREQDLAAWFLFRVHRHLVGGSTTTKVLDADYPGIRTAAEHLLAQDPKFLESIRRNYAEDTLVWFGEIKTNDGDVIKGASTKAYAYRIAKNAVSQWVSPFDKPAPRSPPRAGKRPIRQPATPKAKEPQQPPNMAAGWVILFILAFIVWVILV
jgi:hypothetical protein